MKRYPGVLLEHIQECIDLLNLQSHKAGIL